MLSNCSRQPHGITSDPSVRNNEHLGTECNAHLLGCSVLYYSPAVHEHSWRIGARSTGPIYKGLVSASLVFLYKESNSASNKESRINPGVKQVWAEQTRALHPKWQLKTLAFLPTKCSVCFIIMYANPRSPEVQVCSTVSHHSLNSKSKSSYAPPTLPLFFKLNCFSGSLVVSL